MAAPTYTTTIPRSNPGSPPAGAPRIPDAADTDNAEIMPAVDLLDERMPPLPDDEEDDGGSFAGAPLVQLAQYGGGEPAPSSAPPGDQVREDDLDWLFRATGGGQAPQPQPQRQWPAHVETMFRSAPRAEPPAEERLDDRYRVVQLQRQQESDLDWLMRFTGGYPPPQQQTAPAPSAAAAPAQTQPAPQSDAQSFAESERWWGGMSERVWSFVQSAVDARRRLLFNAGDSGDALQRFLDYKIKDNIAEAQRRQTEADEIAAGTRAGPQSGMTRHLAERSGAGLTRTIADTIKGAAYGRQYATGQPLSEAAESRIYEVATVIDEWAKQTFPNDPARQHQFSGTLAEGFGSMVAFMGPGLALRFLAAGPKQLAALMAVTSGTTGALTQVGSMEDDALRAMREGRTVDGAPVNEETLRSIFPWAGVIGSTEAFPIARFFGGRGGMRAARILSQAVEEGGQEFVQQVAENVTARANYDDKRQWDENAWTGLAVGSILGAGMQGGAELRGTGAPGAIGACGAGAASDRGARG